MGKIVEYAHHGTLVSVDEDQKGKHRQHCLCYRCSEFRPCQDENCAIAKEVYRLCVDFDLVLPVWECHVFKEGPPDLSRFS